MSIIVPLVSSLETFKIFSLSLFFFFNLGEMKFHDGGLGMCLLLFVFPIYMFSEYFYSEESSSFVLGKLYSLISFSSHRYWPQDMAPRILVPQPGTKLGASAVAG